MKLFKAIVKTGMARFPILYSEWCELNEFLDSYLNMSLPASIAQLFPACAGANRPDLEIENLEIRRRLSLNP